MPVHYKMYLAGKWVDSAEKLSVAFPYDGTEVGSTALARRREYTEAIDAAERAFALTREMPSYKREEICRAIARGLEKDIDRFARMITLEVGKAYRDAVLEVRRAIGVFGTAAEEAKRVGGEIVDLDWSVGSENRMGLIRRFPLGVIAGIAPFNFPLNLVAHKIAPAIASGNSIILKPASKTPLVALMLAELIDQTELPKGAVSILPGRSAEATPLIEDSRVRLITFTGSPEVGWDIKSRAGDKKVVLELGGNAGVAVADDADLEWAASRIVTGAFSNAGQSCISVQRIYIHEKIYDAFLERFLSKVRGLRVGNPLDAETDLGSLVDDESAARIESWIAEAIGGGAKVLIGGRRTGRVLEPTILADVSPQMKVSCREAFAPLAVVFKYHDFKEMIAAINDSPYGLQAGIFTNHLGDIFYAFKYLEVGGVMINEVPTYRADHQPYGGVKLSGIGREGVRYAIEDMTEIKFLGLNLK